MIWLATNIVNILSRLVLSTPRRVQLFVGSCLGLIWFYLVPIRRRTAIDNIKKAFPEWSNHKVWQTARRNFENYGMGFIEVLWLPCFSRLVYERKCFVEGRENYDNAISKGRGLFFLTLHVGSWEIMSATCRFQGVQLHVITKKFKAQSLNRIWVNLRLDRGIKLIREEKSTFDILRAIKRSECVGFILDQFMGPPVGTRVKFFGHETGAPAALALFVDRTRVPVVPVYCVRDSDGRMRIVFEPEIPFMEQGSTEKNISFMTQVYTSKIEEIVRKFPEQWLWIHRRWKPFRE